MEEARRTGDISILRDRPALERFVAYVASQHHSAKEHEPVPVPAAATGA